MTLNNPSSGIGSAVEFQSSALPWCTSSVAPTSGYLRYDFAKVTKFINLINLETTAGRNLRVAFTQNGIGMANYFVVPANMSITFDLRVTTLYIKADTATAVSCSIVAGLTNVGSGMMPQLSGTLADGSAGWIGIG
jgi:hypothetical protein